MTDLGAGLAGGFGLSRHGALKLDGQSSVFSVKVMAGVFMYMLSKIEQPSIQNRSLV